MNLFCYNQHMWVLYYPYPSNNQFNFNSIQQKEWKETFYETIFSYEKTIYLSSSSNFVRGSAETILNMNIVVMFSHTKCLNQDETSKSSSTANELGLANVGGVFVVLMGGMGVACVIAVCEFVWKSRKVAVDERVSHVRYRYQFFVS